MTDDQRVTSDDERRMTNDERTGGVDISGNRTTVHGHVAGRDIHIHYPSPPSLSQPPPAPPLPTINREDTIKLFHQLMQPAPPFRVLRLVGEAKQGKSHFLAKVFPSLARQTYRARCATLDLRSHDPDPAHILHTACDLLATPALFPAYHAAYQQHITPSGDQPIGLQALFARFATRPEAGPDQAQKTARHLTIQFAADLRNLHDALTLLLFDAVDNAPHTTQDWLINALLVQLSPLAHVRVIVAGRSLPEPSASYTAFCHTCRLLPIQEPEAYITYCRQAGLSLVEQFIRNTALACDYKPGLFADLIPKLASQEAAHA